MAETRRQHPPLIALQRKVVGNMTAKKIEDVTMIALGITSLLRIRKMIDATNVVTTMITKEEARGKTRVLVRKANAITIIAIVLERVTGSAAIILRQLTEKMRVVLRIERERAEGTLRERSDDEASTIARKLRQHQHRRFVGMILLTQHCSHQYTWVRTVG